jgi:hypothetical protein
MVTQLVAERAAFGVADEREVSAPLGPPGRAYGSNC